VITYKNVKANVEIVIAVNPSNKAFFFPKKSDILLQKRAVINDAI